MKLSYCLMCFVLGVSLVLTTACGSQFSFSHGRAGTGNPIDNSGTLSGSRGRYAPYHGTVQVYRSRNELKNLHYETLGTVTTRSGYIYPDEEIEMVMDLQRQAADMGANAIVLLDGGNEKSKALNRLRADALRVVDKSMP